MRARRPSTATDEQRDADERGRPDAEARERQHPAQPRRRPPAARPSAARSRGARRGRIGPVSPSAPWRAPADRSQPVSTPLSSIGVPRSTVARHVRQSASGAEVGQPVSPSARAVARRRTWPAHPAPSTPSASGAPRRPRAAAPAVCAANAAVAGERRRRVARMCGGADGGPRAQRGHRRVRAEGQRHAGRGELGEPVQLRRARCGPAAAAYMPSAPPHSASKHRLHRGDQPATRPAVPGRGRTRRARCGARRPAGRPSRARRQLDGVEHLVDGGVADRVEAGLQPGRRRSARCARRGRRCRSAARPGSSGAVGVRLVQRRGVRAERAVAEQVARRADGAELARGVDAEQLAPVADDLGHRLGRREREQRGQVVRARDHRAGHLVHARDAERGGVPQRGALGVAALAARSSAPSAAVRTASWAGPRSQPSARKPGGRQPGHGGQQRRRHHRRVHVDPGQVDRAAVGRAVEFGARSAAAARASRSRPSRRRGSAGRAPRGPRARPRPSASASDRRRAGRGRSAPARSRSRARARRRRPA